MVGEVHQHEGDGVLAHSRYVLIIGFTKLFEIDIDNVALFT